MNFNYREVVVENNNDTVITKEWEVNKLAFNS